MGEEVGSPEAIAASPANATGEPRATACPPAPAKRRPAAIINTRPASSGSSPARQSATAQASSPAGFSESIAGGGSRVTTAASASPCTPAASTPGSVTSVVAAWSAPPPRATLRRVWPSLLRPCGMFPREGRVIILDATRRRKPKPGAWLFVRRDNTAWLFQMCVASCGWGRREAPMTSRTSAPPGTRAVSSRRHAAGVTGGRPPHSGGLTVVYSRWCGRTRVRPRTAPPRSRTSCSASAGSCSPGRWSTCSVFRLPLRAGSVTRSGPAYSYCRPRRPIGGPRGLGAPGRDGCRACAASTYRSSDRRVMRTA